MDIPCDFSHIFPQKKPFRRAPPAPFCTPLTCSSPCQAASRFAMAASSAVVFPGGQWIHRFEKPLGHHVFHTDLRILRSLNAVSFVARADFPMDSSVTPPNQTLTTRKIYRPEQHLIGDWYFQMFFKGSNIISSISSSTFSHFNSFHPISSKISPWIIPDITKPVPPFCHVFPR